MKPTDTDLSQYQIDGVYYPTFSGNIHIRINSLTNRIEESTVNLGITDFILSSKRNGAITRLHKMQKHLLELKMEQLLTK